MSTAAEKSERAAIRAEVAEWDGFLQGYDADGRLIVCICGAARRDGDWSGHFCSYDAREGDDE